MSHLEKLGFFLYPVPGAENECDRYNNKHYTGVCMTAFGDTAVKLLFIYPVLGIISHLYSNN